MLLTVIATSKLARDLMEDAVLLFLWFFADIIFFKLAYYSGWILLKAFSLGRIMIEPNREKWSERREEDDSYNLTDMQTALVGFVFWISIILYLALL